MSPYDWVKDDSGLYRRVQIPRRAQKRGVK
jgi:hypothetical protein